MDHIQIIKDILKSPLFSINTICPSYVRHFLPDLETRAFAIFHNKNVSFLLLILYIFVTEFT